MRSLSMFNQTKIEIANNVLLEYRRKFKKNYSNLDFVNRSEIMDESSTDSSSPDVIDKVILVVNIKLERDVRTIYFRKKDDPALVAGKFCIENRLNDNFVKPIANAIKKAIDYFLLSDVEKSNINDLRHSNTISDGNSSSISTNSNCEEDYELNRSI